MGAAAIGAVHAPRPSSLQARPASQAAPELHQSAADLVPDGGLALVVVHRLSASKEAASGGGGGGGSGMMVASRPEHDEWLCVVYVFCEFIFFPFFPYGEKTCEILG